VFLVLAYGRGEVVFSNPQEEQKEEKPILEESHHVKRWYSSYALCQGSRRVD